MGLRNFGKGLIVRKLLSEVPIMTSALKWLTDPKAIGRKRTIAAVSAVLAGMMRGAEAALKAACAAADIVGAVCSFQPGNIAGALEGFAQWLNAVVVPGADLVTIVMGLWGLWAARGKKGVVVTAMVIALIPGFAVAQDQPALAPELKNSVTLSAGATRFYTHGVGDTTEIEGHLLAIVHTPEKTITEVLARFTRVQGAETDDDLLNPRTFRAFVGSVSVRRALSGFVDAQCLVGMSWARDKEFDPEDPNVWRIGCGPRIWLKDRGSFSIIVAHDGSVGGRAVSGELVIKQGDRARYYATYAVPLSAERFRVNPVAITSGVQLDVKGWKF